MPLLLVRHARAGDRHAWEGDDGERPLDTRGAAQAEQLVHALSPFRVDRVLSSPARRCVQTVEPLAAARGLEIELRDELSETRQADDGAALLATHAGDDVLVCGHGGLEHALPEPPRKWRKGATLVVGPGLTLEDELPPPG
jgi:8-oxo-dGTP diphosphatase